MVNLNLLMSTFTVAETRGLETLDARFQDFLDLVQNEDFAQIVSQAEELFALEIYDIRIIGYYAYGAFVCSDYFALREVLEMLNNVMYNWSAVGPEKKKEKHLQTSVVWLLNNILSTLQYHQQKDDDTWARWQQSICEQEVKDTIYSLETLRNAMEEIVESSNKILELFSRLYTWLDELEFSVATEDVIEEQERVPDTQINTGEVVSVAPRAVTVETSYHMQQLIRRLEAFTTLVDKGQMLQAALVADDISQTIENFDPTIYLPQVFCRYLKVLSANIDELADLWENKDTIGWQTMERLYKSDLDTFLCE